MGYRVGGWDDGTFWERSIVVDCERGLPSFLATVFNINLFSCHSILKIALTASVIYLLFLRQCLKRLWPSTVISVRGTFPKSPLRKNVSRYVSLSLSLLSSLSLFFVFVWLEDSFGFGLVEDIRGICWVGAIAVGCEWSLPSLSFLDHSILSGVLPPSFLATVFLSASAFNGDLNKWDVSKVTTIYSSKSIRVCKNGLTRSEHAVMIGGWFTRGFGLVMQYVEKVR